jgi:hypothetical protein
MVQYVKNGSNQLTFGWIHPTSPILQTADRVALFGE